MQMNHICSLTVITKKMPAPIKFYSVCTNVKLRISIYTEWAFCGYTVHFSRKHEKNNNDQIAVKSFYLPQGLNVKLSHDATCVPSTSTDNDGHTERSSTIVPGEPTGEGSWRFLDGPSVEPELIVSPYCTYGFACCGHCAEHS